MLDIKFIRQNPDAVKDACEKKNVKCDVDKLLDADEKRVKLMQELEAIAAEKNKASKAIPQAKDQVERDTIINAMKALDKNTGNLEKKLKELETEFNELMLEIPNIPLASVPVGPDESQNVTLREIGKLPEFEFTSKTYLEIAQQFDLIDVERAAKIAGSRFGFLKNAAALLEFALVKLVFDTVLKEGFVPVVPPVMIKREMARGTGYFEQTDEKEAYHLPDDDLFLVGTSEQSLITMHADETFEAAQLPKMYLGFSTCFRREAGSYGKDTKGILRSHQFDKLEMVIFCKPNDSPKYHELLLKTEEKLMKALKLPYRVLSICTGDLGRPAAAKYDIEAWIPGENKYRETHSTSNCTDFQARRLNIRFRDKDGVHFVHTLNGTAFAIGRIIIAILENYQQKDGTVLIPEVLQPYMDKTKIS
jgi:seryl-tRNA synthetase